MFFFSDTPMRPSENRLRENVRGPNREHERKQIFGTRLLFLHFAHLAARCICSRGENETRVETAEGEKKTAVDGADQKQKYVDQG